MIDRRGFGFGLVSLAFAGLALRAGAQTAVPMASVPGYGPLQRDPAGMLDLPDGFTYRIISQFEQPMSDGLVVPDRADGMGAFKGRNGRIILVRNHEMQVKHTATSAVREGSKQPKKAFDRTPDGAALPGGTTTLVYDPARGVVESQWLSLAGTIRNCSGGVTPWGSWLSCEEDVSRAGKGGITQDHGYVFEVLARQRGLTKPVPLKAMGRFNHEATVVDPATGIAYLTEDRDDGLLYRFLPNRKGQLAKGGRLQAMALIGVSDSRNWNSAGLPPGKSALARWVDLDQPESPDDDLRQRGAAKGATLFARGEGLHMGVSSGGSELFFCCTSGGSIKHGQVMRYRPSRFEGQPGEAGEPGMLANFVESTDPASLNFCDNLTVAPNGHLILCEDQYTDPADNHLRGVTPAGRIYDFARTPWQTEFAGACFSPDGKILFVNLYSPTRTLAITGDWGAFRNS